MTMDHTELLADGAGAISFEVRTGSRRIGCTISGEALEAASGLILPSTTSSRRQSFGRFRMVIHAAALRKLEKLPPDFTGYLAVTSNDLRNMATLMGEPVFGKSKRFQ
jgi:hypothetical protein